MANYMNREESFNLLKLHLKNENNIRHSLAVEALMESLAEKLNQDKNLWGIAGLLHDLDWEETSDDPKNHGRIACEILKKLDYPPEATNAILAHNFLSGVSPRTLLDKALYSTEEITGLITAAVLILPTKKLKDASVKFLMKKFKEKSFARGVSREIILKAPEFLGLDLEEIMSIALNSMREIHESLGL